VDGNGQNTVADAILDSVSPIVWPAGIRGRGLANRFTAEWLGRDAELREATRGATGAATTWGYGPRFLHSTGQLHKGGPPTGRFLQLVNEPSRDLEVPGAGYSFGTLIAAQSAGDLQTLRDHGLPAQRVRLSGDPAEAVRQLTERINGLLQ